MGISTIRFPKMNDNKMIEKCVISKSRCSSNICTGKSVIVCMVHKYFKCYSEWSASGNCSNDPDIQTPHYSKKIIVEKRGLSCMDSIHPWPMSIQDNPRILTTLFCCPGLSIPTLCLPSCILLIPSFWNANFFFF